ncbi:hypothetical protein F511_06425 [Dorcoceras hygrometricum]|uniref:Uncharacterized protein n=1 Tax=Dorcoceras hygrometricum TaxID=472368 RepID=A0A2Z7BB42_9LAMI|nr:hypothetical protein F511_06425 [Dorcoceras hygrometricum]
MSLFDLQDVRIAIGFLATLDLPMVVDLIGIYGLKGPYCTLTTTNWFLQALSVIPSGSWGDVARRFYHDPLGRLETLNLVISGRRPSPQASPPPPSSAAAAATCRRKIVSGQLDEENPSVQISSGLLVHADEGIPYPVVDLIDDIYRRLSRDPDLNTANLKPSLIGHGNSARRTLNQKLTLTEERSGKISQKESNEQALRVSSNPRFQSPNWYQSVEKLKRSSVPPISFKTMAGHGGNRRKRITVNSS